MCGWLRDMAKLKARKDVKKRVVARGVKLGYRQQSSERNQRRRKSQGQERELGQGQGQGQGQERRYGGGGGGDGKVGKRRMVKGKVKVCMLRVLDRGCLDLEGLKCGRAVASRFECWGAESLSR